MENLTPKLKEYKEEFDFLHKRIGEIEWELSTIYYGKRAVLKKDIDILEDQLYNYQTSIGIVVEQVRDEITRINMERIK